MTDAERQRLTELDNKISWNNQTDKGEPLTEDERKEHKRGLLRGNFLFDSFFCVKAKRKKVKGW